MSLSPSLICCDGGGPDHFALAVEADFGIEFRYRFPLLLSLVSLPDLAFDYLISALPNGFSIVFLFLA